MKHFGRPVVLHVCEAFGGGVAAAIQDYVQSSPEFEHHLLYTGGKRTGSATAPVTPGVWASYEYLPPGHLSRLRTIRRVVKSMNNSDFVLHAHSSIAGVYVRIGVRKSTVRKIVYTPHCFAFERRDVNHATRFLYWLIEKALSTNTTDFAACSPREALIAAKLAPNSRSVYLPNIPPKVGELCTSTARERPARRVVAGAGRLSAQKDPGFFVRAALALHQRSQDWDAVWIGGADDSSESPYTDPAVRFTGWKARRDALDELRGSDLYVHSARWEGFPVSVLEAAALHVPVVVRRLPVFELMEFPFIIDNPEDLPDLLERIPYDDLAATWAEFAKSLLEKNSPSAQALALSRLYADHG